MKVTAYPNKTIVEMHPEQWTRKAWCNRENLFHLILNNFFSFWACLAVVINTQLRGR